LSIDDLMLQFDNSFFLKSVAFNTAIFSGFLTKAEIFELKRNEATFLLKVDTVVESNAKYNNTLQH